MTAAVVQSSSLWLEARRPRFPRLSRDTAFDVVVIGGGITGLTAAYLLKSAGHSVAVVEKNRIGDAETGHTTAHLTCVTDTRLSKLAEAFGEDQARLAWRGGLTAIEAIEQIVDMEAIHCAFQRVPGFLHAPIRQSDWNTDEFLEEAALAQRLGIEARFVNEVPVFHRPGICFANQARFQPIEYCADLARAIRGDGCEVFEESEMTDAKDGDPIRIDINGHQLHCHKLVIATHVPIQGLRGLIGATALQTKIYPYSTYAIAGLVPSSEAVDATFWDTDDPYFYLRFHPAPDGLHFIFGGEDHKTGQASDIEERFERLERQLQRFLPEARVDHRWSGQVIETNDGLPYIGPSADNQFVATGFSGNGMTFGTLAGMMACDWVLNRENPWQELFALDRTKLLGGTWEYVRENLDFPYFMLKRFLSGPEEDDVNAVGPGEGKIVKVDGQRCAVSRDAEGTLSIRSAICTHMGCIVQWNGAERTWDCPCHGSRFNPDGEVVGGPAESPLPPVEKQQP